MSLHGKTIKKHRETTMKTKKFALGVTVTFAFAAFSFAMAVCVLASYPI
jgi:hypothetical protein